MPIRFLPASARTPKPWKNGGGVTTDVFVWPENAGMDSFIARISIAEVASDGPFSIFAGIDRTTAILSGQGFDLTFENGATHRLTKASEPLRYSGDTPATSRLIDGPAVDLNAMSRRSNATHRMRRLSLTSGTELRLTPLSLLIVIEGTIEVTSSNVRYILGPLDAFATEKDNLISIKAINIAEAYIIEFTINSA